MAKFYSGGTPSVGVSDYYDGTIPFIRSAEINSTSTELYLSELGLQNSSAKMVHRGDILYALYGATSGEVGISKINGAINQAILAIIPHKGYNSEFLEQWLRKNKEAIIKTYLQGGQGNLSGAIVKQIKVSFPSFDEQQKIGKSFQKIDSLITLHQRKLEHLQEQKKGLLQKMFPKKGETVPEVRFPGFTDAWEQRKLGEVMDVGSVKRIHQSDWKTEGVRFLRARDIVSFSKNEKPSDLLYIDNSKYNEYSKISGKVQKGDLLVTGVGSIGVPMLIKSDDPIYFKDGNIIWFKNNNSLNGNFFYYSFTSNKIQNFIRKSSGAGTVGTYTIDNGKKTPILIPKDIDEQEKVGKFLSRFDALITLHQRKLEKLKQLKKFLLQNMFI